MAKDADTLALYDALVEARDERAWAVTFRHDGGGKGSTVAFGPFRAGVVERVKRLLSDGAELLAVEEW